MPFWNSSKMDVVPEQDALPDRRFEFPSTDLRQG